MVESERSQRAPPNRLLAALPRADRQRVAAGCETVELTLAEVLYEVGQNVRHVYFPADSYASLGSRIDGQGTMEVGLVGNEGMLGIPLILGVRVSAQRALVCGGGTALRMESTRFHHILSESTALQRVLNRYLYALMAQFAQTAACTQFHLLEARLARWLLMTHDRAHSHQFNLTHDFLAEMLGVQRAGVTKAAGLLQRRKLITYKRGHITVVDRAGLESASCACYRAMRQTYERILR